MKAQKRTVKLVVISDVHLGTRGCQTKPLLQYLKSIRPEILILNGDIIDIWQFKKRYWPAAHMKVIKEIMSMAAKKTKVYYITGNHDEVLRKFANSSIGNIHIVNQLVLELDHKKIWFFHGDVFDVIMQHSKWLAKIGAIGYDSLIALNLVVNNISRFFGKGNVSLSKKIKENVKSAVKYINNFENTAAKLAATKGYDAVVCGHIHHPDIRQITTDLGSIAYLNSGDWIENLSALEYHNKQWHIYRHPISDNHFPAPAPQTSFEGIREIEDLKHKELFKIMLKEFDS
ncbi:MAG: UDP-2,3-diacylglucosamine diphosphatase [Bacteroidetes bacterium]|nr:UDP-2,3-diacylglucosamine diphosphatase [Bacteroidota bacterium]MBU2558918.1 UDP-2,3-diacylglucosamine diphosphatase [Bacteroidota bacterium]